jgi:hypothetical protein
MDDVDEAGKVLSQGNYGNNTPSKRRAAAPKDVWGWIRLHAQVPSRRRPKLNSFSQILFTERHSQRVFLEAVFVRDKCETFPFPSFGIRGMM